MSLRRTELIVEDLGKAYLTSHDRQPVWALRDVSFEAYEGEFVSVVGPSGCGKSTLLNCIDGLIRPTDGRILIDGVEVLGPGKDRAMVFQSSLLFPWRSVLGNILYGLEMQRIPKSDALERAHRFVKLTGLSGFERHYPRELSGGMQQRVNLARALACDPKILLLDEPFANLDAQTREFMQAELLRIWRLTGKTAIFITHNISEGVYLSDRIVVLTARPGQIKDVVVVNLPRPRRLAIKRDPSFLEIEERVWRLVKEEVEKTGMFVEEEASP